MNAEHEGLDNVRASGHVAGQFTSGAKPADEPANNVWTFSRSTVEFAAPFATLVALGWLGLAVWRFASADRSEGAACIVFCVLTSAYAAMGWRLRRSAPEDPWEPRD